MTNSVTTPLQITAAAQLLNNQGLDGLPANLVSALSGFNSVPLVANIRAAINYFSSQTFATAGTLANLQALASNSCPALGDSIPSAPVGTYTNLSPVTKPSGLTGLIEQTGNAYLGNGESGKFAQGFMSINSYIGTVNQFINSAVNANSYLGPMFTNMAGLITNSISSVNPDLENFGIDLQRQGNLFRLNRIEYYGTPAGLLYSISRAAGITGKTLPSIEARLTNIGFTAQEISDLVDINVISLFNQIGLTPNQLDRLQRLAYQVFPEIRNTELTDILEILDVTTPNITSLDQLLDPVKTFPLSYTTLETPSPAGYIPIYTSDGVPAAGVAQVVNSYLPTSSGCDELGKVIPQDHATANKAVQVSLQQITGITNTTLPDLAGAILGSSTREWSPQTAYITNDVVVEPGTTPPAYYRAQQDVPVGINLTNTAYWLPTTLGGINNVEDLPLIQAQTTPVDTTVTNYFSSTVATGSGPNGTITLCDVLGTALGLTHVDALNTANTVMRTGLFSTALGNLNTIYVNMQSVVSDAAMVTQINLARTEIGNITGNVTYASNIASLNTQFVAMANRLSSEKTYQTQAGVDYFSLQAGESATVYGFVQNLPEYGRDTVSCGSNEFLTAVANLSTLGGQAMVGAMREGINAERLGAVNIPIIANQIPSDPPLIPIPAVNPAN